jgi:hypothetical protein
MMLRRKPRRAGRPETTVLNPFFCTSGICGSSSNMSATLTEAPVVTMEVPHKKGTILFTSLKASSDKLVPQAKAIVDILGEAGTLSKKELVSRLKEATPSKQPAGRILSFYKAMLVAEGYIKVYKA